MNCLFYAWVALLNYDEATQFAECQKIDERARCQAAEGGKLRCEMMSHNSLPSIVREGSIGIAKGMAAKRGSNYPSYLKREWGG
jgi:hypothetical protein